MKKSVVIIGAGIGGLAAAPLLAQKGFSVTVLEKNSWLGGRAGLLQRDGFLFDTGPSWLMMPEVFSRWFADLGFDWRQELDLIELNPSYKIFWKEKSLTVPRGLNEMKKLFEKQESGAAEKLQNYFDYSKKVYELSEQHVLNRTFTSLLNYIHPKFWSPFILNGVQFVGSLEQEVNKRFENKYLRELLLYHLAFLGTEPHKTSRVYATMNYLDMKWGVYYPKGGIHRLVDAMVRVGKKLGVDYKTDEEVVHVRIEGSSIHHIVTTKNAYVADCIVSNTSREFFEKRLLERSYPTTEHAPSAVLIFAGLNKRLKKVAHHNMFFADDFKGYYDDIFVRKTIPMDPNFYLAAASVTDPSVAPKGKENLSWVIPISAYKKMNQGELDAYVTHIIGLTEERIGESIQPHLLFTEVRAHEYFENAFHAPDGTAIGIPNRMRYTGPLRPKAQHDYIKNLYFVGADTHPGIGMPMCILSARNLSKLLS